MTINRYKIIAAGIIGDLREFFENYLVAFGLAPVVGPWGLTGGELAISDQDRRGDG